MNKTLELQKNIEYERFSNLLDLCFNLSTIFSFTKNRSYSSTGSLIQMEFLHEMNPFYIKTILTQHWHCLYVLPNDIIEVYLFETNKEAKIIIQKYFDNLFLRNRNSDGTLGNVKETPEDLCFFVENKLLLGTVSHESICHAYPFSDQISNEIIKLGKWKEMDYSKEEHIIIEI